MPSPVSLNVNNFSFFRKVGDGIRKTGLGHFEDNKSPIILAILGGLSVSIIGIFVPPTMFWSEFEMETIAVPGTDLPQVWPQVNVGQMHE